VIWRSFLPARLRPCPAGWELSRAFSEGASPELTIHLRRCERCGDQWAAMQRTREVAQAMPAATLEATARARMLTGLLAEIGSSHGTRFRGSGAWRPRFATLALGTAAIGIFVVIFVGARGRLGRTGARGEASAVAIHAIGAATFTRERPLPDELIRLDEGTLQLEVALLTPGQHVRIATGDAELEPDGGLLDVTASGHQLVAVRVWRGRTELRGASFHVGLKRGDQWTRATTAGAAERVATSVPSSVPSAPPARVVVAAADLNRHPRPSADFPHAERPAPTLAARPGSPSRPAPALPPSAPPKASTVGTPPPETLPRTASAPQRASFERGWRLLRSGDPVGAGAAFRDVESESHGDAIAEDAMFWRGVAEARAGSSRTSRDTLASFVARFPRSARAGEASAMLGWLLLDAHDLEGARRAFERARLDPVDRVRASAEGGLARIAVLGPSTTD
jgi:TolA-binding protein